MRVLISILILTASLECFAQTQIDSVKYEKFVKVSPGDIVLMVDGLNRLKELQMYDPKTTDKEKVENFKNIDAFINRLKKTLRIDSLKIK